DPLPAAAGQPHIGRETQPAIVAALVQRFHHFIQRFDLDEVAGVEIQRSTRRRAVAAAGILAEQRAPDPPERERVQTQRHLERTVVATRDLEEASSKTL